MNASQFENHLKEIIIPFWNRLKDTTYGGFYGEKDIHLTTIKEAHKGMILHSRILWFYSNVYLTFHDTESLLMAEHAYDFICKYGLDTQYGGIHWMLSYKGDIVDDTKHTYNQAFAIYALSSYYAASKNTDALNLAYELYQLIENKCRVIDGYMEAFDRTYSHLVDNDKLSENGVMASRTMNTLLHVFEAYCELYRVDHNENVRDSILSILKIFYEKIYNKNNERLDVFFDDDYHSLIDLHSYGHDIEASWLIDRGLHILEPKIFNDNEEYQQLHRDINEMIDVLTNKIFTTAYNRDKCALNSECERGIDNTSKIWWVQAESVIGFYNAYERTPYRKEYQIASRDIWNYIQKEIVDTRNGGEWLQERDSALAATLPVVSPWKCPYHNGRMCLEMIHRLKKEEQKNIPVNPNATKEAKDLLSYLNKTAGSKIITGQHTQTNPMEEVDYIHKTTGKKPKLQGFELLGYSPNINYDDASVECITEVEENKGTVDTALQWAKETNGIVTLTFHWFSPLSGHDKSFYAKNTDFDASRILTKGSAERKAFYHDMDEIARLLTRFQDQKIPVLWRPFHEADGTWFWWGAKGHAVGRELYKLMFDYYVYELHLDNLIWVWNSPNREGYPGDKYVDVVSRDIYLTAKTRTDYEKEYLELIRNTTPHKVAALSEVGYIPDITMITTKKIPWAYYMTWSKEFCIGDTYNTQEDLLQMYTSQNAISLE